MELYLDTERLIIRPIHLNDASFVYELVNTDGWRKFIGNRNIATKDDALNFIQKILNDSNQIYHVFELKDYGVPVGIITFLKRQDEFYPDLGFAIMPVLEGRGYTLEACNAFLKGIEKHHNHEYVIAFTKPHNIRSMKLLEKIGFSHSGNYPRNGEELSYFSLKRRSDEIEIH